MGLVFALLDLLKKVLGFLLKSIKHRLDMLVLIHINLMTVLAECQFDFFDFLFDIVRHDYFCDGVANILDISFLLKFGFKVSLSDTLECNLLIQLV